MSSLGLKISLLALSAVCLAACSSEVVGGGDDGDGDTSSGGGGGGGGDDTSTAAGPDDTSTGSGAGETTSSGGPACQPSCTDCAPVHRWSAGVVVPLIQETAVLPGGDLIVAGYADANLDGDVDFGGGVLANPGSNSTVVARFAPDGSHVWSKIFGNAEADVANAVAVGPDGSIVLTGLMHGAIDFGGGAVAGEMFLLKLDPDGNHVFSQAFPAGESLQQDVAVSATGDIVLAAAFVGAVDLGAGELEASGSEEDVVVGVFDASGALRWQKAFATQHGVPDPHLAWGADGTIRLVSGFTGSLDLGGATVSTTNPGDEYDTAVFVATLDADGNHLASRALTTSYDVLPRDLIVDAAGDTIVTGVAGGDVDLGGGLLEEVNGPFLAKYGPGAEHIWSQVFPSADDDYSDGWGISVTSNPNGDIVLLACSDETDFGGGPLGKTGPSYSTDVALARFDASGCHVWSRSFGPSEHDLFAGGVAFAPDGDVYVVAESSYLDPIDFGGGPIDLGDVTGVAVGRITP